MSKVFKVIFEDYDCKMLRHIEGRRYHLINVIDFAYNCGESEAKECGKWAVELKEIDLDLLTDKQINEVMRYIGQDTDPDPNMNDEWLVDACADYGCAAPLFQGQGNNRGKLIAQAKKESRELDDPAKHEEAMNKPVNAIGSTAREFGQGDFTSAMIRGAMQNDPSAKLMLKIHGAKDDDIAALQKVNVRTAVVNQIAINKIPSDDPLAYMAGFMDGQANREKPAPTKELAPAYLEGYRHAIAVRLGEVEKPTWIK